MDETPLDATRKYVRGIKFPVNKEDLISAVERNGAPDDLIETLRAMDKPRFTGPNEVQNALWMAA